ncbi:SgcJ/EcaC family oxidoreductase [[Mycobacterium] nativiensis]|uniref:SgcJ/EcaC family oxidoreductase n=1 Tax=[Mycobacterium] nativiensis TaxID=2855503 RepID=A0ABU5Y0C1_9MYCO|nr:SgcJ/EcaC family oxidoreductase [Mycolicibacter sp. MYC340]MEB3033663.1 SgcJ/EcaC family oxidoreductase [Mycolicibacter sp. MYC340]
MNGDEVAIRELLAQQVAGWNTGDPAAYAAVFAPDADYITFLGAHHRGRAAISASYAPLFANLLRGSRLEVEVTGLRFLTSDVALIHARAVVTRSSGRRSRGERVNTSVAVRTGDGWLLAASQNTTHRLLAQRLMRTLFYRHSGGSLA